MIEKALEKADTKIVVIEMLHVELGFDNRENLPLHCINNTNKLGILQNQVAILMEVGVLDHR